MRPGRSAQGARGGASISMPSIVCRRWSSSAFASANTGVLVLEPALMAVRMATGTRLTLVAQELLTRPSTQSRVIRTAFRAIIPGGSREVVTRSDQSCLDEAERVDEGCQSRRRRPNPA